MIADDWALSDLKTIARALDRAIETADIDLAETDALETLQYTLTRTIRELETIKDEH